MVPEIQVLRWIKVITSLIMVNKIEVHMEVKIVRNQMLKINLTNKATRIYTKIMILRINNKIQMNIRPVDSLSLTKLLQRLQHRCQIRKLS